ncbi:hypothetical protein KAR91_38220 [Candidatus Pacearchaeota archaeon]|nr:hypothetical protein [Candidatus Pacearchaeota archaeon]
MTEEIMEEQAEESVKKELFVTIDGEKIFASRPKFGMLKKAMRIQKLAEEDDDFFYKVEGIDALYRLIVDIFDTDELTMENIESVDLGSILKLDDISEWINSHIPQKKVMEAAEVATMRSKQKEKREAQKKT